MIMFAGSADNQDAGPKPIATATRHPERASAQRRQEVFRRVIRIRMAVAGS
jgi:hypothetical protein